MRVATKRLLTIMSAVVPVLVGCATDDPHRRAKTGAAVGAVAGAVLGHQVDRGSGKWIGAAVGALAGGATGHYMDNQQRDFEQALEQERQQNQMEIERLRDDTLKLSLDSEVSFDFDRAYIKPTFKPSLNKLTNVLRKYNRTVVHVVGHTDSTGSDVYNQRLSERRAGSVATYLQHQGVPYNRLRSEGRGETEPRDTNETEAGRQLNRRVEIYIKPIVEGRESQAYESPRY
ncbi:MAG: OmpA family protein [Gammaproteobacteria bacterium]|nr:OmpA family protein [Gammaproteobacteria bacterium]